MTGGKPVAIWLQSISGVSAINLLVAFYDIHGEKREVYYFFILSRTPHETNIIIINITKEILGLMASTRHL
jgi:hypothetical protein